MSNKYGIGTSVYLKTDVDQKERIITGIITRQHGTLYALVCGTEETWHYDLEFSTEKDLLKTY